jgi:hypothetical protein
MKAIQAADRGGYDALRLVDIPRPQPRAGQAWCVSLQRE